MLLSLWVNQFPNLLWGQQAEKHQFKAECEARVLLPSVSASYSPSIRLLFVSCPKLPLWNLCPTLYQMCLRVTNIGTKLTRIIWKMLFQCNRKTHSMLNQRILLMWCGLSSNLPPWPGICAVVATGTHETFALYSQTCDVLIFLMRNIYDISYSGMLFQATMDPPSLDATPLEPIPQK